MSNPTKATRHSWQSEPLTGGEEYGFCLRIATAAHPGGIETQNTDEHSATADSFASASPILGAKVM